MRFFLKILFIIALLFGTLLACKDNPKKEIKTEKVAFQKEGELNIYRADSLIHSLDIEIAESEFETQTGLMYRESMEENEGMLFVFPDVAIHYFYMKNTEFPLDIIYIDQDQKLVTIKENAQPYDESSIPSEVPVKYVLEINAGLTEKWGIQIGDSIAYSKN